VALDNRTTLGGAARLSLKNAGELSFFAAEFDMPPSFFLFLSQSDEFLKTLFRQNVNNKNVSYFGRSQHAIYPEKRHLRQRMNQSGDYLDVFVELPAGAHATSGLLVVALHQMGFKER